MPIKRWIYEKTNTSGGGGVVVAPDAPAVVPGVGTAREIYNGLFEIDVPWTPGAGATPANFAGVAVFLEDPDISSLAEAPLDGTVPLDKTSQISGKWQPVRETDSFTSPAVLQVDGQPAARDIRVYLQAYGKVTNATLIRANKAGATPNVIVHVPAAAGSYVSGQEYAWLITNPSVITVADFDNPAGPQYYFTFNYTVPDPSIPLPPGLQPFAGVQTVYEYTDGRRQQAVFLAVNKPDTWISDEYGIGATQTYIIWFCSTDAAGNVNSIVKGVTPSINVTIVYPPAGQATAPDVTGLALSNSRFEPEPDGTIWALADVSWTNPTTPRYSGLNIYRIDVQPPVPLASCPLPLNHTTLYVNNWPTTVQAWTLAAISYDQDNKPAADPAKPPLPAHIPLVTWNIGPPGTGNQGQEYAPIGGASLATVTTEQQLSTDGVVMMRHHIAGWTNSTDNKFGGMSIARVTHGGDPNSSSPANAPAWWDAPKGATTLVTDWEPAPAATAWDFYFVSRDMMGHRNTIFVGFTPELANVTFTPMAGNIIPSRLPSGWWDPTEFQWPAYPAGAFQALQFVAQKIYVGSILRVGGGNGTDAASFAGQQNGQIAVYNASNVLRGWIGQQDNTATPGAAPHSIFGGWFAELYVGGDGPPNAPLYAQQDGTVIVGGFDMSGSRYPYISIRDNTGIEMGRVGARIGYGASGNQSGPEVTIQGAWFREFAYGGQSFTDWRMLAKMDPTNPQLATVQMRNINLFTIDYMQNYPSGTNPTNAEMTLKFGFDAFVADGGDSRYWKFPGITLLRTGTTQGIALIDRGILINGPSWRLISLVSYNGDQFGNDAPPTFWGSLTMASPSNGVTTITLASGSAGNGNPYFTMIDQNGSTTNFSVDQSGNVTIRGSLSCGPFSMSGVLSCAGVTASGPISCTTLTASSPSGAISATGSITGGSFWVGGTQVINGSAVFQGAGVNTAGSVICGPVTTSGDLNITSHSLYINDSTGNSIQCASNAIWSGRGVQTNSAVYAGSFGINGVAVGASGSFTTANGKTVTVNGGLITAIA